MSLYRSLLMCTLVAGPLIQAQQYLPESIWGNYRCPTDNGTLPSATYYHEKTVFTACSQKVIDAPVEKVYDVLINFGDYHKWNSFVQRVDNVNGTSISPADLYTEVLFYNYGLFPPSNIPYQTKEIISVLQHNDSHYAVASWKYDGGTGGVGLRAEHTNVLTTNGQENSTLYVSWDSYYGVVADVIDPILATNLRKQFSVQGDDLKRYVEAMS